MFNSDQSEAYSKYGVMALDWEKEPHDYVRAYDDAEEIAFLTRNCLTHEKDLLDRIFWGRGELFTHQEAWLWHALLERLQNEASNMLLKELLHGDKIQAEAD
jgi:hypothetical protein